MNIFLLLCKYVATLGFIGHLPAPGSIASLCTIVLIHEFPDYLFNNYFFVVLIIIAYSSIYYARRFFNNRDASCIVIDEVIGTIITFFYMPMPLTGPWLLLGFLLFRFFDITKIGYARWERNWTNAGGILIDDMIAGVVSNICLRIVYWMIS